MINEANLNLEYRAESAAVLELSCFKNHDECADVGKSVRAITIFIGLTNRG